MAKTPAIELKNITKTFGKVVANKNVSLTAYKGEILSILGENGSGKTTLMNMISGIYFPDEGQILVDGHEVTISSPKDAFGLKIGMIHQHFKLVDVFSAAENIILGLDEAGRYNLKVSAAKIKEISDKYGFDIDPMKKIHEMSVSEKQTVEIIKVLYRGADILILDEPTAVLTPQETQKLFAVLRKMREDGKCIIIITHKLHEVLSLSDRVAVLRKGEYVGTVETASTSESELTEMMVGKKISLNIERSEPVNVTDRLIVKDIECINREGVKILDDISFTARSGDILGIAGSEIKRLDMFAEDFPRGFRAAIQLHVHGVGFELVGDRANDAHSDVMMKCAVADDQRRTPARLLMSRLRVEVHHHDISLLRLVTHSSTSRPTFSPVSNSAGT